MFSWCNFRFMSSSVEHNIQTYILELVHDQLTRRQPLDSITRNLLKLLTVTCGYSQIRLSVSHRLEMWLQNPKVICLFVKTNININIYILVMICRFTAFTSESLLRILCCFTFCFLPNFDFLYVKIILHEISSESFKFCLVQFIIVMYMIVLHQVCTCEQMYVNQSKHCEMFSGNS